MRNAIQRFMYGRYGNDQLNTALVVLYLILWLLEMITQFALFGVLSTVLVFVVLFRMLSRNLYKRREENAKFLRKADPILRWYRLQRTIRRDKDHVYFKCPSCSQQLRVPRGKGKITVNCRNCGASFQEKS